MLAARGSVWLASFSSLQSPSPRGFWDSARNSATTSAFPPASGNFTPGRRRLQRAIQLFFSQKLPHFSPEKQRSVDCSLSTNIFLKLPSQQASGKEYWGLGSETWIQALTLL